MGGKGTEYCTILVPPELALVAPKRALVAPEPALVPPEPALVPSEPALVRVRESYRSNGVLDIFVRGVGRG